jgi:biotin synthase
VISRLGAVGEKEFIKRICIQAVNYPDVFTDVLNLLRLIHSHTDLPISLSCQPFRGEQIRNLADAGLDRIGIPLDAASPELFSKIKGSDADGPYTWNEHLKALEYSVTVFGRGRVSTHFIVGLGETDAQLVSMIQKMVDMGVYPSLFSFTPIRGTALESLPRPPLARYRRIQVAQHLITEGISKDFTMKFTEKGDIFEYGISSECLRDIVISGKPFLTCGCPDCNRPFYNEMAGGPLYNYPRPLTSDEIRLACNDLEMED